MHKIVRFATTTASEALRRWGTCSSGLLGWHWLLNKLRPAIGPAHARRLEAFARLFRPGLAQGVAYLISVSGPRPLCLVAWVLRPSRLVHSRGATPPEVRCSRSMPDLTFGGP